MGAMACSLAKHGAEAFARMLRVPQHDPSFYLGDTNKRMFFHPPLTGGIIAISSRSCKLSPGNAYSLFTATM